MRKQYRLTAGPAGIGLAAALAQELAAQGAGVAGGWEALEDQGGWELATGSGGRRMSLVVSAADSAAVYRAVARAQLATGVTVEATVTPID